jgi:hypothetical protein
VHSGLGNLPTLCIRDPDSERSAGLLEQAARIDAVSQNEFVRQAVLDRIAARKADPAFQAAVRRAVKANQRVFERLAQT